MLVTIRLFEPSMLRNAARSRASTMIQWNVPGAKTSILRQRSSQRVRSGSYDLVTNAIDVTGCASQRAAAEPLAP